MHPICKKLDENLPKLPYSKECKHCRFDHLETACVLSDVYSVKKGEPCAIFAEIQQTKV